MYAVTFRNVIYEKINKNYENINKLKKKAKVIEIRGVSDVSGKPKRFFSCVFNNFLQFIFLLVFTIFVVLGCPGVFRCSGVPGFSTRR